MRTDLRTELLRTLEQGALLPGWTREERLSRGRKEFRYVRWVVNLGDRRRLETIPPAMVEEWLDGLRNFRQVKELIESIAEENARRNVPPSFSRAFNTSISRILIECVARLAAILANIPGRSSTATRISNCGVSNPRVSLGINWRRLAAWSKALANDCRFKSCWISLSAAMKWSMAWSISSRFVSQISAQIR